MSTTIPFKEVGKSDGFSHFQIDLNDHQNLKCGPISSNLYDDADALSFLKVSIFGYYLKYKKFLSHKRLNKSSLKFFDSNSNHKDVNECNFNKSKNQSQHKDNEVSLSGKHKSIKNYFEMESSNSQKNIHQKVTTESCKFSLNHDSQHISFDMNHDHKTLHTSCKFKAFLISYLSYPCVYLMRRSFIYAKTSMENGYGYNKFDLSNLDLSFLIMYTLGQFISGIVIDFIKSSKLLLFYCYLCSSAVCLLLSLFYCRLPGLTYSFFGDVQAFIGYYVTPISNSYFIQNFDRLYFLSLIVTWGIGGFIMSLIFPATSTLLLRHFSLNHKGAIINTWATCQHVGGLLSSVVVGFIINGFGLSFGCMFSSIIYLLCGFLILKFPSPLYRIEDETISKSNKSSHSHVRAQNAKLDYFEVIRGVPNLINVSLAYFSIKLMKYVIAMWISYFLVTIMKFSHAESVIISIIFDVGGFLGVIVCSFVTAKYLRGRSVELIICMSFISAILTAIYATDFKKNFLFNFVSILMIGFVIAGPEAILANGFAIELCEMNNFNGSMSVNIVSGTINGFGSVGTILQSLMVSHVVDRFGFNSIFYVLSLVSITPCLLLLPVIQRDALMMEQTKHRIN